jgi:molecular chaperone HtpG
MDAAQQLLPHYLRFVRGIVDSNDLPLNVSRELLQENELLGKIRAAVIRRSLDLIGSLAADEEKYGVFWKQFGAMLKEGIVEDLPNRDRLAPLLRFASTHSDSPEQCVSLADYVARMMADQKAIYFITAENHRAAAGSPQLEVFRRNGIEVLLLSDRVDEWMMGYFTEYDGKRFQSVAKGALDLPGKDDEAPREANSPEMLSRVRELLGERVSEVRLSRRLTESASCLVLAENEMALHMRRLLEQAGQEIPDSHPALELNPGHPLVEKLLASTEDAAIGDLATLLFEQAVLAEGGQLEDPAGFVRRMNAMLLAQPEMQDDKELPS